MNFSNIGLRMNLMSMYRMLRNKMKYIITESQYKMLMEEEPEVLHLPSVDYFDNWDSLQQYLERKGNPLDSIGCTLNLYMTPFESIGNLTSVGGNLNLRKTLISKIYTEEQIRQIIDVRGEIYM